MVTPESGLESGVLGTIISDTVLVMTIFSAYDPEKKRWERPRGRWLGAHEIKDNIGVAGMSFTNFANIRILTTQLEYHLHFKLAQRSHKNN